METAPITEAGAEAVTDELRRMFPSPPSSLDTADHPSSSWTPEELTRAKLGSIQRHLRAGWKFLEGYLEKGNARKLPSSVVPLRTPGEPGYNPRAGAFALRMGATLIESGPWRGRYQLGRHIVNRNGQFISPDQCPECGSYQGELRFRVRVEQHPDPFAKPWEQAFTYCRRCCTPEEAAQLQMGRLP